MIRSILVFIQFLVLFPPCAFSQEQPQPEQKMPQFAKHGAYLEVSGTSFIYSLNYEYRYNNNTRIRSGLTLLPDINGNGSSGICFPVSYSYIVPFFHSKVELGGALNFMLLTNKKFGGFLTPFSGFTVIPSVLFGYRYEPDIEALYYRVYLTPIFSKDADIMNLGLSVGYGFKDFSFLRKIF